MLAEPGAIFPASSFPDGSPTPPLGACGALRAGPASETRYMIYRSNRFKPAAGVPQIAAEIVAVQRTSGLGQQETHALQQIEAFAVGDASYLAPPAQIRTCGFPAYGSHLG